MLTTMALRSIARSRCALSAATTRSAFADTVHRRSFCDASAAAGGSVAENVDGDAEKKFTKPVPAPAAPATTWNTIVIGEIVDLYRHPEAERLNVCHVNIGDPDELLQIICGAPNARQGARVPVAKVGTKLAIKEPTTGDVKQLKIKKSKLRGELSQGMICSEAELGLADHSDGILILEDEAPIGTLVQDWPTIAARLVKEEPQIKAEAEN